MSSAVMERIRTAKALRFLMAFILVLGLLPTTGIVNAQTAYAAPAQTISGYAYVYCVNPGPTNDDGNLFDVTMPDGSVVRGHCIDHGNNFPADGSYPFSGTWNGSSYDIVVDSSGADRHPQCVGNVWPCQRVGNFTWTPTGKIDLQKESSNTAISGGNSCYSLAAEYTVYRDSGCTSAAATIRLNGSGYGSTGDLPVGTYYVKETKAGSGFALDGSVYRVDVQMNQTTRVNGGTVYDTPQNDPAVMWVGKIDLDTTLNMPQGSASLENAEYTVRYFSGYYDSVADAEASGNLKRTWVVKTNAEGQAMLNEQYKVAGDSFYYTSSGNITIPLGTILIQETKAPEGYLLDGNTVHLRKITSSGIIETVETYNTPKAPEQVKRGGVAIQKLDSQTGKTPQGNAGFGGIHFEIINDSANAVVVDGTSHDPGQVVTTIITDETGYATTADNALPYGSYIVREKSTNASMLNTSSEIHVTVTENKKVYSFTATDDVVRGGVTIEKRDIESELFTPLGSAVLDGTEFEIKNLSTNPVIVEGVKYAPGKVVKNIQTKDGVASTANDTLPYGHYSIQEVAVGNGYLLTDGTAYEFDITQHGKIISAPNAQAVYDQVKRGDLEFVKVREDDMKRLVGVPFQITSKTTGESHIVVTDDNGYVSTSSSWNAHTSKTNANDAVTDGKYDDEAGVWFGLTTEGWTVDADDSLGALPYDTYTIEELPCAANDGLTLVKVENVVIKRDSVTVDLGTIDDRGESKPYIHTTARDGADGDKLIYADTDAVITDHVEYTGLIGNETYVMTATLMDKDTGKEIPNTKVTKEFVATAASGSVEMTIPVNLLELAGHKVVVYESLTMNGKVQCDHKDMEDTEQTLRVLVPEIGTSASDAVDGDQTVVSDPEAVVVDTVSYKNLAPGREYTVNGKLMVKSVDGDGNVTEKPLTIDGEEVVSAAVFTPEDSSGTVDLTFAFDASELAGQQLVAFETLSRNGVELAVHADINDEGQTVTITKPEIGTSAVDGIDGDNIVSADPEIVVVDTVSYTGLVPGKEYTVNGKLMVKFVDGDGNVTEKPLTIDGTEVVSQATFTPLDTYGTATVEFRFDGSGLPQGTELVAFETLSRLGKELAVHADINDEAQTVVIHRPEIGTTARDGIDGDKNVTTDPEAVVIDTVSYTGLVPGKEYTLQGKIIVKSVDDEGDTAEKPLVIDGEEVVSQTVFTPDHSSGTTEMTFSFDSSALEDGTKLVVFETLLRGDKEITVHKDINDEGQTVTVVRPEIGTSAVDGMDDDKNVVADPESIIVDTVIYSDLVPGKEYQFNAQLMVKSVDDEGNVTEEPLLVGEEPVTATATFTPEHPSGTVDVTFNVDTSALAGKTLVVYEQLTRQGKEIAVHTEINDEGQTVEVTEPQIQTTALDGLDGDKNVVADPENIIVDTVSYDNLVPGKEYVVNGKLMIKGTNEFGLTVELPLELPDYSSVPEGAQIVDVVNRLYTVTYEDDTTAQFMQGADGSYLPVSAVNEDGTYVIKNVPMASYEVEGHTVAAVESKVVDSGWGEAEQAAACYADGDNLVKVPANPVVSSATFTPDHPHGTVEITFQFDGSRLAGKKLVAFESLTRNGIEVTTHADIEDEAQTVDVIQSEIRTLAVDGLDGDKNVVADGKATIVDTVSYKDLIPNGKYEVSGIVMDKSTGLPLLAGADADEVDAAALKSFMEEVAVASGFGYFVEDDGHGNRVYVGYFEDQEEQEEAKPEQQPEESEPENELAELAAFFSKMFTGEEESEAQQKEFKAFTPINPDYEALTSLFAGNADLVKMMVMASQEFSPEYAEGTVDVVYNFDASNFIQAEKATDTVVFEILLKDDVIVAAHADIEDEGQTTTIVPSEIATTATDKSDGDHIVQRSKDTVIVDTVEFTNLIPGKEYELQGVLMDKSTGKKLLVNDKYITASTLFTPNEPDGSVVLEFKLDTSELAGKEIVVFENLYKEGVEIAVHADINDENQTVTVEKETPPGNVFDKTGNMLAQYWWVLALLALAACGSVAYGIRQRKLAAAEEAGNEDESTEHKSE